MTQQLSQNLINYIKKHNEKARKYNEENRNTTGNWTSLMLSLIHISEPTRPY